MTEASFQNKRPHDAILAPVAPERSARPEDGSKYVFFVDPRTFKTEIKQAVEAIPDVKVASVNTQNRQRKARRARNGVGRRKNTKCAIIPLREGSIDIYGDVIG